MSFDVGRVRHLAEQMHRSEDDAGDPIDAGFLLAATGDSGLTWTDPSTLPGGSDIPVDHGSMAATETLDISAGHWHRGTLNANCTITVSGFVVDEGVVALIEIEQDGTGGWDITWDADLDFGGADDQPNQAALSYTAYLLWSSDGDTNIYGAKVGAAETVTPSDATPLVEAGAGDPGVSDEYSRGDHVHPEFGSSGGIGEILISDTPSTPLVFADLIQNEAQDDLVYADP